MPDLWVEVMDKMTEDNNCTLEAVILDIISHSHSFNRAAKNHGIKLPRKEVLFKTKPANMRNHPPKLDNAFRARAMSLCLPPIEELPVERHRYGKWGVPMSGTVSDNVPIEEPDDNIEDSE
jgi:hypothetical protein